MVSGQLVSATWLSLVFSHLAHFTAEAHIDWDIFSETASASHCLLNILFSRRGDSCSLAESWSVTGAGACAGCTVQYRAQYTVQTPGAD